MKIKLPKLSPLKISNFKWPISLRWGIPELHLYSLNFSRINDKDAIRFFLGYKNVKSIQFSFLSKPAFKMINFYKENLDNYQNKG